MTKIRLCQHSCPKQRQCQRMFKLLHNCTHFTCQASSAQNPPSQALTVHEPRTSRCSSWIQKSQRNQRLNWQHLFTHRKRNRLPEKKSALLTTPKPLTMWITTYCGKFLKRWEYQTTLPASCETFMQVRNNSQNCACNNRLAPNGERSVLSVHCHPAHLTSMQTTSCEMPGWTKPSWNQDCQKKYQ